MKKLFYITIVFVMLGTMSFVACTDDVVEQSPVSTEENSSIRTCNMFFSSRRPNYDQGITRTSSEENDWINGDVIYLKFSTESGDIDGTAQYNEGAWLLSYHGELIVNEKSPCVALYFEGAESILEGNIVLGPFCSIFEDKAAVYEFDGEDLYVTADLSPKTGRIRFEGSPNQPLTVWGITYNSSFNISTGSFTVVKNYIDLQVNGDGSSNYVYGEMNSNGDNFIGLISGPESYSKNFKKNILEKGKSGFLTIPTSQSYSSWYKGFHFVFNDVDFTMIPVRDESKIYLLGETEVTEQQYQAMINGESSSSRLPKTQIRKGDMSSAISSLKEISKEKFRFPTSSEWLFAAKGGLYSNGYKYCGSNNCDEVAWYRSNTSKLQIVKQKQPNEIGLYDMSGNVSEMTSTKGGAYLGGEGYSNVLCGGNYSQNEQNQTYNFTDSNSFFDYEKSIEVGFRLCLELNTSIIAVNEDVQSLPSVAPHVGDKLTPVDLNLPSGTLWANMNLNSNSPEEVGGYYAWGEGSSKYNFTRESYSNPSSFDDAACKLLGELWAVPTSTQLRELVDYCSWKQDTLGTVAGCLVTGSNGNSIFLPYTGLMLGREKQYSKYNGVLMSQNKQNSSSYTCSVTLVFRKGYYIVDTKHVLKDDYGSTSSSSPWYTEIIEGYQIRPVWNP